MADFLFGGGALPFVDFGVAVGKGEAGGAVVVAGGEVAPLAGGIGIDLEVAVVDGVGVFVEEGVGVGGVADVADAEVLLVGGVGLVDALERDVVGVRIKWAGVAVQ